MKMLFLHVNSFRRAPLLCDAMVISQSRMWEQWSLGSSCVFVKSMNDAEVQCTVCSVCEGDAPHLQYRTQLNSAVSEVNAS